MERADVCGYAGQPADRFLGRPGARLQPAGYLPRRSPIGYVGYAMPNGADAKLAKRVRRGFRASNVVLRTTGLIAQARQRNHSEDVYDERGDGVVVLSTANRCVVARSPIARRLLDRGAELEHFVDECASSPLSNFERSRWELGGVTVSAHPRERPSGALTVLRLRTNEATSAVPPSNIDSTGRLSPRERQLCWLLQREGGTNRTLAASLRVSPATVKSMLERIYNKLDVRSRTELVVELHRRAH